MEELLRVKELDPVGTVEALGIGILSASILNRIRTIVEKLKLI
jgi:hypothetical protein